MLSDSVALREYLGEHGVRTGKGFSAGCRPPVFPFQGWLHNLGRVVVFAALVAWAGPCRAADPTPTPAAAPDADALYQLGQQLFGDYAPPEIKDQYYFPSKEQWDAFAARLQRALDGNSLNDLSALLLLALEVATKPYAVDPSLQSPRCFSVPIFKSADGKFAVVHA
jgi:hypothetical protein